MRILFAPHRITVRPKRGNEFVFIAHNDSERDAWCFPTIEGLGDQFTLKIEPGHLALEPRCAGRFTVKLDVAAGRAPMNEPRIATWVLRAEGRDPVRAPVVIVVERHRSVCAHLERGTVPFLNVENDGDVVETLRIEALSDAVLPRHALPMSWTVGPGKRVRVPIVFESANAGSATLCISGGPQALLVETPIVQSPRAARAARTMQIARGLRKGLMGAGAVAASLLITVGTPNRMLHQTVALSDGIVAQAMPFVALEAQPPSIIHFGHADRLITQEPAVTRIPRHASAPEQPAPRKRVVREPQLARVARAAPRVTDLRAPTEVRSGGRVAISFRSRDAASVRVVAKIGPTIIRTFVVRASSGQVEMRAPRAGRESRLMTVRVYARNDTHVATRETLIAIAPT